MSNVAAGKDTDDEGEQLNDVEKTLNSLGITLRKSQYEWRSFEDVLDEVADKWKMFEDTEKSHIATAIAGTRQQENFRAMMNNWDSVKDLTKVAETSMGSATEKMEVYLDSVEAKTKELSATWEEFIIKLNQSESYKDFLDMVIFLIKNLPTVITLVTSLAASIKMFSVAGNLKAQAATMRSLLATAINTETLAKQLSAQAQQQENIQEEQSVIIKGYKSTQLTALIAQKKAETMATEANIVAEQTDTTATELNTVAEQTNNVATTMSTQKRTIKGATTLKNTTIEQANTVATNTNTVATEGSVVADVKKAQSAIRLKTVLSGLALTFGIVTAAISIASIGIMAYQGYVQGLQETVTETSEKIKALNEEIEEIDSINSKYEDIIKNTKSAAEQKEELTRLQGQLISTYGEEAGAIDLVNGKYEKQIELLKGLQKDKLVQKVQEYTNSQKDRDKLLNTSTTNLVIGKDEKDSYSDSLIGQIRSIVSKNGGTFGLNKDGDYGIWANGETQPQIYEALQEFQKELIQQGKKDDAKKIANMFNRTEFTFSSMKEDYEKFKEASQQERAKDLAQFELDNYDEFQSYKNLLTKKQDLYDQYNKTQDEKEKKRILNEMEDISKQALDKKQFLYDKIKESNVRGLADTFNDFFKQYDLTNTFKTDPTSLSYFDDLVKKVGKTTEVGKNIQDFGNKLDLLDEQFETGKINATQYFDGINKQIDSIDVDKVDSLYGGIQNLNTMMSSMLSNSASYIGTLMNSFSSGNIDDFEFFDNLSAAVSNFDKITNFMIDSDKKGVWQQEGAVYDYDSFKDDLYGKDKKMTMATEVVYTDENGNRINTDENGNPVIQPKYKDTYYKMEFDSKETEDEFKELTTQADKLIEDISKLKADGARDDDDSIVSKENQLKSINKQIEEITDGTKGVDDTMQDLKDSIKEINDMDFKGLDKAYENLNQAFEDGKLKNNVEMTLDQIDGELKNSAMKMAAFLKEQSESSNAAYSEAAKTALENMGLMADATQEQIATAIINTNTNLNAAANGCNKIASTAMGKSIQNLGQMLIKLGDAMDGFEVSIPIKIPMIKLDLESLKKGGALFTSSDKDLIQTEIKIGAAGTIKSIGNMLANADIADTIGNMFTPVEADVKKSTGTTGGKGYTPSGGGSKNKKSGSEYTPEEAAKDKKSILNDIEDYERDIEADLEDQTEQLVNHYNLERNKLDTLREELDYYDAIYDSTENTTKWLETQLKILDEESKKVAEMQKSNDKIDAQRKKIYAENKQYNVESWFDSEGNDTLAYGNMLNDIEYKKEAIQRETAQKMRAEYNRIANSTDKDTISDAKEKIKLIEEEGDLKIKELDKEKEKIENIHDSVETLNDAWDENQEKIRESLQELNDRIKSVRDELIDDLMEQLERATDKMNKSIEKDVTRLEQLRQVQESYNSILNDTIDTQDELLDELQANLDSYQYLDEDMRQLMFNEDDYKKLSGVLGDIQEDIAGIWEDHYNQIQSLTEDEMYKAEYITAETERQLAAKQREYELAKAELDIAKAKTNLENVKNERNVRIFANGQWQWVADPNAVKDAQKQLADAEREKNRIEREAEQQELLDSLDRIIDADNLQIDKNNELLEKIQEAIEQETEEVKSIDDALQNIKDANLPELNTTLINALGADGGSMTELLKNINKNQSELAAALRGQTIDQAVQQLKSGTMNEKDFRELVTRLGYVFNDTTGKVTTQDGEFDAHYSGWSKKPNNDVQTTTGNNGVQVTGQNNSSSGASNSGNSNNSGNSGASNRKSNEEIAKEVWQGKWGNGQDRKNRLTAAGYDYNAVQKIVNRGRKYDSGGIANGIGLMVKDTLEPERVLSPKQTKSFDNLINNMTTNPILKALSKTPNVVSNLSNMGGTSSNDKNYYFSNFTVQANDIEQFISSIETIIPMKNN